MNHAEQSDDFWGGYYSVIPDPVSDDASLRWGTMVLYAKITKYARKGGFCYASNATLIREMTRIDPKTGAEQPITERTLQSMLAELKARGHIWIDTGPHPPDKNGIVRKGRRIYIGRTLVPPAGGEENFTPEENFTQGMKKISPPIISNNNKSKYKPPIIPQDVLEVIQNFAGEDAQLLEALTAFVVNRATPPQAKPVKTSYGMKRLIGDLVTRSDGRRDVQLRMIDNAIQGNWRGFWAPREDELPEGAVRTQDDEEGIDGI